MPKVCSGKGEHACLVFISWDLRSGSMVSTALHWAQPDKRWKQKSCIDRTSHKSSRKYHVSKIYLNISSVLLIFALKHGIINVPKQNCRIKAILHQYNAKGNSEHPRDARRKEAWAYSQWDEAARTALPFGWATALFGVGRPCSLCTSRR